MKYMKMLGLAVIAAAALTALIGAGSAQATVLCKTDTDPCTEMYSTGQELHAVNEGTLTLRAGIANITCTESTAQGTQSNTGGAGETVNYALSSLTFGGCNATVNVTKAGSLIIHSISGSRNGTITSEGASVDVTFAGVTCTYGTVAKANDIGTLTSTTATGATPTLDVSAELTKEGGGFLCSNPAHWEGSYSVTTPMEGYVSGS